MTARATQTKQWIGFAVIAFLALLAYTPSLMHVPRADQVMYLAEVGDKTSLWDLTIGSMDLNRHRHFNPGDEILFRPVDYMLLGAEKYFFGYNFMWWQGVGIALHMWVIWLLLRLLLSLNPGWPAIFFTAFFALLFVNAEMVTWHHINGYLIALACLLIVFWRVLEILHDRRNSLKDYWILAAWLTLACFTHEMANLCAIVVGLILFTLKPQQRPGAVLIFAVPCLYVLSSVLNAWIHPFTVTAVQTIPQNALHSVGNLLYAMGAWAYAGLFPFELQWLFAARNMIAPEESQLIKMLHLEVPSMLGVGLILSYIACTFQNKPRGMNPRSVIALIAFSMAVIFAFMISHGRGMQWHIGDVLRVNTYYMYIFWLFVLVGFYALIDWSIVQWWAKVLLSVCLAGLLICNASKLYMANQMQMQLNNDIVVLVQSLNLLVQEHKSDPEFSFFVAPQYPGNYIYKELRSPTDPPEREYSFAEALYPQYFTYLHPKYRFMVNLAPKK